MLPEISLRATSEAIDARITQLPPQLASTAPPCRMSFFARYASKASFGLPAPFSIFRRPDIAIRPRQSKENPGSPYWFSEPPVSRWTRIRWRLCFRR